MHIVPIILSGGLGSRLWPSSLGGQPKQFINLLGSKRSLFQETLLRVNEIKEAEIPIVICNNDHRFFVQHQSLEIGLLPEIIIEPSVRDTFAAISCASIFAHQKYGNCKLVIFPSDHRIQDMENFAFSIENALTILSRDQTILLGANPLSPNPNFGYIQYIKSSNEDIFQVEKFIEKPSEKLAKKLLDSQNIFWNCGIFLFESNTILKEIENIDPISLQHIKNSVQLIEKDLNFLRLDKKSFEKIKKVSIDKHLIENIKNIFVLPLLSDWNDYGSWESIFENVSKDSDGNVLYGNILSKESKGCFISSDSSSVLAIGVDNMIIIHANDKILICSRSKLSDLKSFFGASDFVNNTALTDSRKTFRPWGFYESIVLENKYQVKMLTEFRGQKLSLQLHHKRSENWVIVDGEATIQKGNDKLVLAFGESIFIPKKTKHSIENNGDKDLKIIEVQCGDYIGEDDIQRFEDLYNRL